MNRACFLFLLFLSSLSYGQEWTKNSDTLSKKRLTMASSAIGTIWLGGTIGLSTIWYSEFSQSKFHLFDDSKDWLQMDKIGHIYTTAHLSEANYRLFKWTGLSNKKSAWLGTGIGFGFQTTLEVLDGKSSQWGFSWSDMAANTIGAGLFLSQQLIWKEQRFTLKFSSHLTEYAQYRPNVLGSSYAERFLKDYNGQTYWLSFSPKYFLESWPLPKWLCLSFGYSVDEKLVGSSEYFTLNNKTFQASRQFLFSLDLDLQQMNITNRWLKAILRPIHYIKIPFPTLILNNHKLTGSWLYF